MLIKPNAGLAARIKVVGIGGGGGNSLSTMIDEGDIAGVEFIALNTDAQALLNNKADVKVQIGESLTKGLGSGGDPQVGLEAAEESREKIKDALEGADMIFIAAGEGGGTGTGAAPIVAQIGKEVGALTVAVVTKPFAFEGNRRKLVAEEGTDKLKEHVDTLIIIPNQKVLEIIDTKASILEAFKRVNSVLHLGVKGIAELITVPGLINVDFADVRSVMADAGTALMGIGIGTGEKRTITAIKQAISSPLLETSMEGAKGVLFNIVGGPDMTMNEVDEAASIIAKAADPDADIIFGAVVDEQMMDQVKIIVVATKFDEHRIRLGRLSGRTPNEHDREREEKKTSDSGFVIGQEQKESQDNNKNFTEDDSTDDEFDIPAFLRKK